MAQHIKFNLLSNSATHPVRGTPGSAGYDLSASEGLTIPPRSSKAVRTSISMSFPQDTVCFIKPRSGLALRHSIDVLAGVIDSDYTGEVMVILINHSDGEFSINAGDRIAQMVFLKLSTADVVGGGSTLRDNRGDGGFGSSGN